MFDLNSSINISVLVIVITFVISIGILYLSQPSWIQRINNKGKTEIAPILLISYAMTFSLPFGVASLLLCSKKQEETKNALYKPPPSIL